MKEMPLWLRVPGLCIWDLLLVFRHGVQEKFGFMTEPCMKRHMKGPPLFL